MNLEPLQRLSRVIYRNESFAEDTLVPIQIDPRQFGATGINLECRWMQLYSGRRPPLPIETIVPTSDQMTRVIPCLTNVHISHVIKGAVKPGRTLQSWNVTSPSPKTKANTQLVRRSKTSTAGTTAIAMRMRLIKSSLSSGG